MTKLGCVLDFPTLLESLRGLKAPLMEYMAAHGNPLIPNEEAMARTWGHLLDQRAATVWRLVQGDTVGGILMGLVIPDMLTAEPTAVEVFWFVRPEFRQYSLHLLEKFEEVAKQAGCKKIVAGSMFSRQRAMGRLYRRRGYKVLGEHFEKVI